MKLGAREVFNMTRLFLATFCLIFFASNLMAELPKVLPFYFPTGMISTTDPVKQMQEYIRSLMATCYKFQGNEHNPSFGVIPGSDSIVIETNIESTSSVAYDKPEKCRIILDHFVRMKDGRIRVTQLADQFYITEAELKIASDDLVALVGEAARDNYEFFKDMADVALNARIRKIFATSETGISTAEITFKNTLDDKDPIYGVTLRELNYLPKPIRISDFVPRELHLGYTPKIEGIFGACWLNTGIIYYNPQARILDYLTGRPKILQHEMVHCNYNLEKFPLVSGFDAELFAMLPEVFLEENKLDLFFHGYCKDLREICEIYFGFDFSEAKKQIFKYDLAGSIIIDETLYREYSNKLEEIKKELVHTIKNYIIPEFYSDPLWWSSMHDKLGDNNGLFWIMMARHYKPTILNNSRETAIWLSAHHEEIMDMAKESFIASGAEGDKTVVVGEKKISFSHLRELSKIFSLKERERIKIHFENNPESLKGLSQMSIDRAVKFIRDIAYKMGGVIDLEK